MALICFTYGWRCVWKGGTQLGVLHGSSTQRLSGVCIRVGTLLHQRPIVPPAIIFVLLLSLFPRFYLFSWPQSACLLLIRHRMICQKKITVLDPDQRENIEHANDESKTISVRVHWVPCASSSLDTPRVAPPPLAPADAPGCASAPRIASPTSTTRYDRKSRADAISLFTRRGVTALYRI